MHKKIPKICTGCRVSKAKIYLYHSYEIAIARPHSKEWQTDTSVQKQWSMYRYIMLFCFYFSLTAMAGQGYGVHFLTHNMEQMKALFPPLGLK